MSVSESWQCQHVLRHVGLTETSQVGYQEKNSQTVIDV